MATKNATARSAARTTPGTYFLSLTVENVRCFGPAQTLDLSDGHGRHAPWTVILGENGLGKTTLLTCLVCSSRVRHRMNELLVDVGLNVPVDTSRRQGPGPFAVHRSLARGSGSVDGKVEVAVVSYGARRQAGNLRIRLRGDGRLAAEGTKECPSPFLFEYSANRKMPLRHSMSDDFEKIGVFLDYNEQLRDPQDWLLKADYNALLRGAKAKRFNAFAERVRDALVRILPDVDQIRIQAADEPGGSPRVEARTPDGWVPLRRLGFGYQSQIAWLVDFASRMFERYPDSPDPLAEPAVVLIDEIDLHMHPRWQREVVGYLTERCPSTQFIVTAHSPLVVQAAASANIVLLRREDDHVVIDNDPEVLSNWRVDQILTSELFGLDSARPPQIEAPLKERRALLAKPKLSSRERARLADLDARIGDLPAGESAEDRRAMELIRRAAAKLERGG